MQDSDKISSLTGPPPTQSEDLPYVIELWETDGSAAMKQVLARSSSAQLAQEIFKAARGEYPDRRISLRKDDRILADSA